MKKLLSLGLLLLTSCSSHGPFAHRENGTWKLLLKNGSEVEWIAPYAIRSARNCNCVDYTHYADDISVVPDDEVFMLVPKEICEKIDYFGSAYCVVRYLNSQRTVFPICTKGDIDYVYGQYLKNKYGSK